MAEEKPVASSSSSATEIPTQPSSASRPTTHANSNSFQSSNKRKRSISASRTATTTKSQSDIPRETNPRSSSPTPTSTDAPPLPSEPIPPPLPSEPVPDTTSSAAQAEGEDDGWTPVWDATAQSYYFFNRFTQATQWENPRVPSALPLTSTSTASIPPAPRTTPAALPTKLTAPATLSSTDTPSRIRPAAAGGYNPAIHGDYDPNADYAQAARAPSPDPNTGGAGIPNPTADPAYAASAQFNRFTGRFQSAALAPENFNDENKSRRQMNAYFDVDAAANSHDGRSLKAERAGKKLSKSEVKAFRERRKEKKEEKRRAWLRD